MCIERVFMSYFGTSRNKRDFDCNDKRNGLMYYFLSGFGSCSSLYLKKRRINVEGLLKSMDLLPSVTNVYF